MSTPTTIRILDIPVHDVTMAETLDAIGRFVSAHTPHQICTVNPEFIMAAQNDLEFKQILNRSALNLPDGIGVVWAAKRQGHALRERVAGSDLIYQLADRAARTAWNIFLLGAAEGVADQTAIKLRSIYPGVNIVGAWAGSPRPDDDDEAVRRIQAARADIVLVAYGAPKQDKWIDRNLARTGASVAIGVGGSFDFVVGTQRRAPQWLRRLNLEWLYRLVREPRRWRRQLALPRFVWKVVTERRKDGETAG
ncbi:MAG: WecB/TagA/CpsF family glycosyltransferase [Chloroflexi bacterium]|nr:WecB/TagA/CpsF family glycosyltransferase [Chloroflexota bacterium]